MQKTFGIIAAFYGMAAVVLGAFGAHALKDNIDMYQHQIFEKGVQYQFYHVAALLAIFILGTKSDSRLLKLAGWFFTFGIFFFSGSLYLLATRDLIGIGSLTPLLWPVTPLGGLCLITGWVLLLISMAKL